MIIHCSGCQKALEVDETRFTQDRMRGVCPRCETIIEVQRPKVQEPVSQSQSFEEPVEEVKKKESTKEDVVTAPPVDRRRFGLSINQKLQFLFLFFILVTGGMMTFLYLSFVPEMMNEQVRLRTVSVARAFSGSVQQALLVKNYLQVNQTALTNADLPNVAYVSVLNKRGIPIAGIFGDQKRFDANFRKQIETEGFPRSAHSRNHISPGKTQSEETFTVGGQKVFDVAIAIPDTGGEAHVAIFTEDADIAVKKSLIPLLEILGMMVLTGSLAFIWVGRSISKPIQSLTQAAEKISVGKMDHPITVKSGGEIGELAQSLERMRFSINTAMDRLMQR